MAYGAYFKNGQGTTVIGENIVPVMVTNITRTVSSETSNGWRFYYPPKIDGHLPGFTMTSSINQLSAHGVMGIDGSTYNVYPPERIILNDGQNLGNIVFSYTALGDVASYPSGGYGLEVRNDSGQVTFNSNSLLLSPDNIVSLNSGDTVTIPNGKTVCPLMFYFAPYFQTEPTKAKITRNGSTSTFTASRDVGSGWCCSLIIY